VIGLDIGGANTKAALVDAAQRARIVSEPFEVWREPEGMADVIARSMPTTRRATSRLS
jgi:uncharacterized hydantoinase/oxoprolinase family protein